MRPALALFLSLITGPLLAQAPTQGPALVGYLPQWGLYGTPPWSAKQLVTSGSAALLTQINYAQAFIRDGKCVVADPNADIQHPYAADASVDGTADAPDPVAVPMAAQSGAGEGASVGASGPSPDTGAAAASGPLAQARATPVLKGEFHQLQQLHRLYPHIRMLISIEGKPAEFADAAQAAKRVAFVSSCVDTFLRGNLAPGISAPGLFSGIDMDWEYPNGTATDGTADSANFSALLVEFRRQMDAYGVATHTHPVLTIASGAGLGRYQGVDWALVARTVDLVGLMNYDYNGPWQQMTGIVAPLYPIPGTRRESGTVDQTVQEYEAAGVPPEKLLVGVPFYGYHWTGVADPGQAHGLGVPGKPEHSDSPYWTIAGLPGAKTPFRDEHSQAPWLFDGDTFWTYDDAASVTAKAEYARAHQLGGMMVWELSGDTADGALLKAMHRGLRSATVPAPRPSVIGGGSQ